MSQQPRSAVMPQDYGGREVELGGIRSERHCLSVDESSSITLSIRASNIQEDRWVGRGSTSIAPTTNRSLSISYFQTCDTDPPTMMWTAPEQSVSDSFVDANSVGVHALHQTFHQKVVSCKASMENNVVPIDCRTGWLCVFRARVNRFQHFVSR